MGTPIQNANVRVQTLIRCLYNSFDIWANFDAFGRNQQRDIYTYIFIVQDSINPDGYMLALRERTKEKIYKNQLSARKKNVHEKYMYIYIYITLYKKLELWNIGILASSKTRARRAMEAKPRVGDSTTIATLWTEACTVFNKMKSAKWNWDFLSSFITFLASPSYPSLQQPPPPPDYFLRMMWISEITWQWVWEYQISF